MGEGVGSSADARHKDLSLFLVDGGGWGKGVWSLRHAEEEGDAGMFPVLGHGTGGGPNEGIRWCVLWCETWFTTKYSLDKVVCKPNVSFISGVFLCYWALGTSQQSCLLSKESLEQFMPNGHRWYVTSVHRDLWALMYAFWYFPYREKWNASANEPSRWHTALVTHMLLCCVFFQCMCMVLLRFCCSCLPPFSVGACMHESSLYPVNSCTGGGGYAVV